jgi:molybdopterin-containing oxidoreductase family membrane subunit
VVSFDFTIAIVPGWHSTFFPPYFVAGAIYSGFAMVLVLAIPLRWVYGLEGLITDKHLENSAKVMLATGLIVAYSYLLETFTAWYSGDVYDMAAIWHRMTGPYAGQYWLLITCNLIIPQALWSKRIRQNPVLLFIISMDVLIGMWLERYIIIVTSLAQDYLVSSWRVFNPTRWDWATYVGTIGLFMFLFFLFIRLLPMISIFEVRTLLPQARVEEEKIEG